MKTELVTSLKRRATEIITDLQDSKTPVLITQYGKPAAYLLDVETYETLERKITVLEGIALGEQDVRNGNIISQEAAKERLEKWLK